MKLIRFAILAALLAAGTTLAAQTVTDQTCQPVQHDGITGSVITYDCTTWKDAGFVGLVAHHWYDPLITVKSELLTAYGFSLMFLVAMYAIGTCSINASNAHKLALLKLQFKHEELKVCEREVALDETSREDAEGTQSGRKAVD
jgi:hypothetical protein